jgi:hypothetical protein
MRILLPCGGSSSPMQVLYPSSLPDAARPSSPGRHACVRRNALEDRGWGTMGGKATCC